MACDGIGTTTATASVTRKTSTSISPYNASVTLFFFLLMAVPITTAHKENSSFTPPATSTDASTMKVNGGMDPTPTRRSRRTTPHNNAIQIPPPGARTERSPSWRQRVFNASVHEVPSGPNPISNREPI
ncbi:hypothetical protein AAG906_001775 [Vitis piasezkii]